VKTPLFGAQRDVITVVPEKMSHFCGKAVVLFDSERSSMEATVWHAQSKALKSYRNTFDKRSAVKRTRQNTQNKPYTFAGRDPRIVSSDKDPLLLFYSHHFISSK